MAGVAAGSAILIDKLVLKRLCYIGADEQLVVKELVKKKVINGPNIVFPSFLTVLSYKKRKATPLNELQYCLVEDTKSGSRRVVAGPTLLFLGPYEELVGSVQSKVVLGPKEGLIVTSSTGEARIVKGPFTFIPDPLETVTMEIEPLTLTKSQWVKLQDKLTGEVWVVKGPTLLFLEPHWKQMEGPSSAYSLKAHQYIRLQDSLTGQIRVERGEKLIFPSAFETPIDNPAVSDAIDLKGWEYIVVQDKTSGKIRTERGERLVWLGPSEKLVKGGKQNAIKVDDENAALVRNLSTGALSLVENPQLFFPNEDEEVVEVRTRIKLADNEAMVLKDQVGAYHFRYGDSNKAGGKAGDRSFFLPPYWEQVTQMWSRGRRRERRDLAITIFDMRAQFMSFEFNCRTMDNVEMVLEGTFFWEVVDLEAMLRSTGDASGDVCAHARSCFIALVSKVTRLLGASSLLLSFFLLPC